MTPDQETHHHPVVHQALDKLEDDMAALGQALAVHDETIAAIYEGNKRFNNTVFKMGQRIDAHDTDLQHAEDKITDLEWRLQRTRKYLWFMFGWMLVSTPLLVAAL